MTTHSAGWPMRPKARIMRTLGEELISSEAVAVVELVKNAYDADATRVLIRFIEPLVPGLGGIELIDNGVGMALETVQGTWLEPATPYKKVARSSPSGRRVLGEKGIGRFAASKLAEILELITRSRNGENEVVTVIDWRQFDSDSLYLDQVSVTLESRVPVDIRPSGTIASLWGQFDIPSDIDQSHGTILRMTGLRSGWDEIKLENLKAALSRLVRPPALDANHPNFLIYIQAPPSLIHLSGEISPPESLSRPDYRLWGHIDETGRYELQRQLRGIDQTDVLTGELFPNAPLPACGPIAIDIRAWDRDDLGRPAGTFKAIAPDLDGMTGISIYRDGFRVLPYGEPHDDWLNLDKRRVNNPSMRLSNNQIIGSILIGADTNPELKDQSNREGLVEGPGLDSLRQVITSALVFIEKPRFSIRRELEKEKKQRSSPQQQGKAKGLFDGLTLADVKGAIEHSYPGDRMLIKLVEDKERQLETQISEAKEVLARYRRLATLGQLIDMVLHDGRSSVAKIREEVRVAIRNLKSSDQPKFSEVLQGSFDKILTQAKSLSLLFNRIAPLGGRTRGRPRTVALEEIIRQSFDLVQADIDKLGVTVRFSETKTIVTVDESELQSVFLNLATNSVYWLRRCDPGQRLIRVDVNREDGSVVVIFSDSGPGIPEDSRDRIFDPYYSERPDGTGLGLTIAGDIVLENYDGTLELINGGPLPGACFRITLRKRIG